MRSFAIRQTSRWGLGLACIIVLAACRADTQPATTPSGPTVPQANAISAAPPTPTAIPAVPTTQPPAARSKETLMPEPKPSQPSTTGRPTIQLGSTLVPEGAAPAHTPISTVPAHATAPAEAAKADLARRRAVAPDTIHVIEVRDVTWPDPGLGCPQPGMAYKQVPVDGLLIRLESGGQVFEYHSGGGKAPFLCEQPAARDSPASFAGRT